MSEEHPADAQSLSDSDLGLLLSRSGASSYANVLKRRASPSFESLEDDTSRKRLKEDVNDNSMDSGSDQNLLMAQHAFADNLAQELNCGCCSELCYHPVVVSPCQHFFCGSCCVLWIRNGGSNCPACRGVSTSVTPSRPLEAVIDVLLRAYPAKVRAEGERLQADEVYKAGTPLRIPTPREASPEPNLNQNADFARPCPHCLPGNPYGWRCPQPIPDPVSDPEHAWHFDDGTPPGHLYCGNCENLLAIGAPTTTKCDMCQVSFCGVGVQGRCIANPLQSQHPHGISDVGDLIQMPELYECFGSNTVEVEYLLDYVTAQGLTPRHIYREIVTHLQSQPTGFKSLIELELFVDLHGVAPSIDPNPEAPRTRICRLCAAEILLWGLKDWWVRERQKGYLDESVSKRTDCPEGSGCSKQKDLAHAREYNHIISHSQPQLEPQPTLGAGVAPENSPEVPETGDPAIPPSIVSASSVFAAPGTNDAPSSSQDFRDAVDALM